MVTPRSVTGSNYGEKFEMASFRPPQPNTPTAWTN